MIINFKELSALNGLPFIQRLVYLQSIRPYADYQTGIAGINRAISYQSIVDQLHITPRPGIKSETYSRSQIRRAIEGLERAGLIEFQSEEQKLILRCPLATLGYFVQNKADTNPSQKADTFKSAQHIEKTDEFNGLLEKADIPNPQKADTSINNNKYLYIYLLPQFEKFWNLYPERKSKQKAWEAFQAINPDETLCTEILTALQAQIALAQKRQSQGLWVPAWKYPANWLSQCCWNDELDLTEESPHEKRIPATSGKKSLDPFWDACKGGVASDEQNKVLDLANYRQRSQAS